VSRPRRLAQPVSHEIKFPGESQPQGQSTQGRRLTPPCPAGSGRSEKDYSPMPVDHIRYDLLTQDALRAVLRTVLADAAKSGLPGEHHFYISFATTAPGVRLSPRMRAEYPEEMTIVLQHQFWDLEVKEDGFEVGLAFGGIPERLTVPFGAIKSFFDPAAQFGLQFQEVAGSANAGQGDTAAASEPIATGQPAQPTQSPSALPLVPAPANAEPTPAPDDPQPNAGAQVVRLDRFRKK
jgi:uncharacterized protein